MPTGHTFKGRSKTTGRFVMLPHFMLDSVAWHSLSHAARAIYIELTRRYNGRNNGYIGLSARDAGDRCRMNKNTVKPVIAELVEKGFIELAQPGGFSFKIRHAAEYRLTLHKCDRSGGLPTKAFSTWKPINENLGPG